jgi:arylsulfatase A-like enzyme
MKKLAVRATWLPLLGASLVAALLGCGEDSDVPRLNLLLVTLDTTRADHLSAYGYDKSTSPHLDALASESTLFELAMAQASVTPVSHASILTGLEPFHHGLRVLHGRVGNRLPDDVETLAQVWRAARGRTAAFVSGYPVTDAFGLAAGFDQFDADFGDRSDSPPAVRSGVVNTGRHQRRADGTTSAALDWLAAEAEGAEPFFLWVHYFDPHDTLVLPPRSFIRAMRVGRGHEANLRAAYDADILFMDRQLGRLLDAFKKRGLWDETIVVVVADHGEGLGDHGWWSHGLLYQEQIRVPLIVRIPGVEGVPRVESMVRTTDLMPTVLEATGVPASAWPSMDGASLLPAMRTGRTATPRLAYADSVNMLSYGRPDREDEWDRKTDKLYSLSDGRFKLIYHQLRPEESEFYDLAEDPHELENLAAARAPEMMELMERLEGLGAFSPIMPGMTPSDAERLEGLKSLGYVE